MKRPIDWEDLVIRTLMVIGIYCAVLGVTALLAGVVQAAGGSLLAQCATAFLPPLIPAAAVWWTTR